MHLTSRGRRALRAAYCFGACCAFLTGMLYLGYWGQT